MEVIFLKPESIYAIVAKRFLILYFFECRSEWIQLYFGFRPFFKSLDLFFLYFMRLDFLLRPFCSHILLQNHFASVFAMYLHILPLLAGRIFFHSFGMSGFVLFVWSCFGVASLSLELNVRAVDINYSIFQLYYNYFTPWEFFTAVLTYWLSLESRLQRVTHLSKTRLSILADHNYALSWLVSFPPPIFICSATLSNPLGTDTIALTAIGITITLISQ